MSSAAVVIGTLMVKIFFSLLISGLIPQVSEAAATPSVKSGEKAESAYFSSQYKTESSTSSGRNKEERYCILP